MSPQPGEDVSSPDSIRPSGIASVFRGLTGSKSTKSPPPLSSSTAALPRTDFSNAVPISSRGLSANHMDAFELLKHGNQSERISAANTLKFAITEYPLNPVLEIWYAAKDLIEPNKPSAMRQAGWELLTECVKHSSSTDLERKEYFQTVAAPANADDFHLQLAALVDLTNRGRILAGFDYELLPLLTKWLQDAYNAARAARRASQAARGQRSAKNKAAATGEDQNFAQLFAFILDVIKFNFNPADEKSISDLIDCLLDICMSTSVEEDLRSCISVIDAIVTFGSVPSSKLKSTIQVLSSIFCLVQNLNDESWNTLSNLCLSHNGQASVRILLDVLRNPSANEVSSKDMGRDIRGALAVLQKLLSKTKQSGYPPVPYALLVDGLSNTLKISSSPRIYYAILLLINSLFNDENEQLHRLIVEEDWSVLLDTAAECYRRIQETTDPTAGDRPRDESMDSVVCEELQLLIARLDVVVKQKSGDFVPRQTVIRFFASVHQLLSDNAACTVLDYFSEFRCCSPSDLQWEANLALVLDGFFNNRNRSSDTRLRALQAMMDAFEIVDLVGDGDEENFIPRLANSILQNIAEEADVLVLDAVISFMTSVVISCDIELFDFVINALRAIVINNGLKSPIASPVSPLVRPSSSETAEHTRSTVEQSPSNVVTRGYVRMFMRLMNFHNDKSQKLFNVLVSIASLDHCEIDARLTAMKLLFRLRADWANRIFITNNSVEAMSTATVLFRTESSLAKKQAEEVANMARLSRTEATMSSRTARGVSIGQGQTGNRQCQMWKYPDPGALPEAAPSLNSPILRSHIHVEDETKDEEHAPERTEYQPCALDLSAWLNTVSSMLRGCDWEIYSFVLVHLPSQLSNHAIFRDAIKEIQALRQMVCEQIRQNSFQEPPNALGLRRADIAICLYHSLTMILSYHEHFGKSDEDEIVKVFVHGISTWERSAKCCIHALSICCHELPLSTSRSLLQMLNQMAAIITQPFVSVHILEFLACLSRLHNVYVNFREDEFRIVFAICFRYLEYAREKKQIQQRNSHVGDLQISGGSISAASDSSQPALSDDLPQYVHALAYHVILFWFLALKLPDRVNQVGWIAKKLFADTDGPVNAMDDHAVTSIDFMQRVTFADVDESAEDPYFTEDRFGDIAIKRWLIGNSIVTVKQATSSGWAQIIKRQPSGTSAYTVRESYRPPPPHQIENHVDITREGKPTSNSILPSHLLVQLMSPIPQSHDSARPIPLPDDDVTQRTIRVFDRLSSLDGHKVGVIYIGEGQTEEAEILANVSGSDDYLEFLNGLGTLTKLKGANFNTQGLDREFDTDGQYTFCWRDRVTEIVFHVTTQMPTNLERDSLCVAKKRHIGNDFVNIIFNDSGLPFKFDTFPSQFNFVNIVITPASPASFLAAREVNPEEKKFYTVQVMSKPGFPSISPASDTKMVSLKALPAFIRLLAMNASVFSHVWHNREDGEHISSWTGRLREIKRLREKHGPKLGSVSSTSPPTLLANSMSIQPQPLQPFQDAAQQSGSSVRDSFNSLRRTSVATFFTNTSEQTSHRSSILSTAQTNDTEVGTVNGIDSLVESVDFSKWA